MRKFVMLRCFGVTEANTDEIILTCYGPRGGTRAIESASPEKMRELRNAITLALESFPNEKE